MVSNPSPDSARGRPANGADADVGSDTGSAFVGLMEENRAFRPDESFPRSVRPRVFAWLWVGLAMLLMGLVLVFVRYWADAG